MAKFYVTETVQYVIESDDISTTDEAEEVFCNSPDPFGTFHGEVSDRIVYEETT